MNALRWLIICSLILLSLTSETVAKDWRGIVPLQSHRNDIVQLLGEPDEINDIRAKYFFEKEDVYIVFSGEWSFQECARQLPQGTILLIEVTPKTNLTLSDLQLDEKKLVQFDPSQPPNIGYAAYIDEEQGIIVRTFQGRVDEMSYIASTKDRHICPAYYENPKSFVQILVDFIHRDVKSDDKAKRKKTKLLKKSL